MMQGQGTVNFDFILFGATGDLAMRKLFPSLFQAHASGLLHESGKIIATGRSSYSRQDFLKHLNKNSKIHLKICHDEQWEAFLQRIEYVSIDIHDAASFKQLKMQVRPDIRDIVIYFSISPEFFIQSCEHLANVGLNDSSVRIVLEKPLGVNLNSCKQINEVIGQYYKEEQIYRIDHYLGKESVQNLLFLRFGNPLFEALWHKDFIKNVQITVFEQLGVEARGEFYDRMGALRDMLQNHMLQMLCLFAMEKPDCFDAQHIRTQKLKLLQSLKPIDDCVKTSVIRAQYIKNGDVLGYLEEDKIMPHSQTETFVALRLEIDCERWQGVPFYLRTGKRMAESFVEIAIVFKDNMSPLLGDIKHNRLVIRLQPESFIKLYINTKDIGKNATCHEDYLSLDFLKHCKSKPMDAYERLILDVIDANPTSFNHKDELEAAWRWLMPILESFKNSEIPLYPYQAYTTGPEEASELLAKDGHEWV